MRELWIFARRALKVFVVALVVVFALFYFVFDLGLVFSALLTFAAASGLAWLSIDLAALPDELE